MKRGQHSYTLLEVLTVIIVIAILAGLTIPVISMLRARAQRFQCSANLHSLYVGTNLFLQENGSWPQIPRSSSETGAEEYAKAWIGALAPFGVDAKAWICPTIQGLLQNPDYSNATDARIDYIPMPFDDKPTTPHEWPRAPWFVERGDVHGNGNLIIFTDGSISDLKTEAAKGGAGP